MLWSLPLVALVIGWLIPATTDRSLWRGIAWLLGQPPALLSGLAVASALGVAVTLSARLAHGRQSADLAAAMLVPLLLPEIDLPMLLPLAGVGALLATLVAPRHPSAANDNLPHLQGSWPQFISE